jgi:Cyclic nucleotide-binding domain
MARRANESSPLSGGSGIFCSLSKSRYVPIRTVPPSCGLACATIEVGPSLFGRKRYGYKNEIEEASAVRSETQEEKRLRSAGLSRIGRASRTVSEFQDKEVIFSQGDAATSVLYIQKGSVKLTVVNESGKEAIVAIFGSTDFFGEGCMAGQPLSGFPALVNTTEYTTSFPASCAVMSAPSFGSS